MQVPINTYILKCSSFCNINCSYCYMFNLKDTTFRGKAKVMPLEILETAATQMVELAVQQNRRTLNVSFHGGEPMLAGKDWFARAIELLKKAGAGKVEFRFTMQSNAMLVDDEWLDLLAAHRIHLGISLDGPRHINDRARVNFAGRSTYQATVDGIQKLQARGLFGGVLCVIDPSVEGLEIYRHFLELGIQKIDFLLPLDHNWDSPPASLSRGATPFADYLISVFDEWWRADSKQVRIRIFESIIRGLMGASVGLDALGGDPVAIVTIDTDGSIEPLDSLRAVDDKFTDVGLRLGSHPISALYDTALFQTALLGRQGLSAQCQQCPFMTVCGGGYLPHRYSRANQFNNPSIYCQDLWKLINHITRVVAAEVRSSISPVEKLAG